MPKAYSKPCQIAKIMRHIENTGIVRTVYFQAYLGALRHTEIYSGLIEVY